MNILITGITGFIGQRLAEQLSRDGGDRHIMGLSRSAKYGGSGEVEHVQGSFDRFEDLRSLDRYAVDAVVHLAAVTGGCSEEDGLAVNVQGTRRLYRYLLDRGCRRFITASSIAATGSLDRGFLPLQLPIPDDHPCLARDAYGLSKGMVEELTRYFHRLEPEAEFINLRLGAVVPDESWTPPVIRADAKLSIPFVQLARVYAGDVVEGIVRILDTPGKPRVLTCNLVGPDISSSAPAAEMLHGILADRGAERLPVPLSLEAYMSAGRAFRPLYAMERLEAEFGFKPRRPTRSPL